MLPEKVAHSKETEEVYAKSMFPEILGQKLITINKRIEKHELPPPRYSASTSSSPTVSSPPNRYRKS